MECVIFVGIQASGKSSFYKERFFNTHIRINLDMLKTRYREKSLVMACIHGKQSFVIDNTNPTSEDRAKYIEAVRQWGFRVVGYYFEPDYDESVLRNEIRQGKEKVPKVAIKSTIRKIQKPLFEEGFDELYHVKLIDGSFVVQELQ
ncbi:AAA family ATPase [Paenibacillus sp. FSL H7-0331]|uniref:AAA family ATPase n=1 Tax=Paenibacillus sp. FSL H7-0331 TaxID=1920421 RepID=UPI00096FA549|nr:AAA family ATPase [Paenibacillus sp. FSL H7-0331]OME94269.1 kinase [Paenibacillus sp. FSL H7-0331]